MKNLAFILFSLSVLTACGRQPSDLLRYGQLPIYDFPLYLTEGASGQVWSFERDASKTLVAEGLDDPRGIATDRYGNIYVAEYGSGRLLKLRPGDTPTVLLEDLQGPSIVAVDSFGDVFVTQDGTSDITRVSDRKVFATYQGMPTAFAFGVDDIPVVGIFDTDQLMWGWDQSGGVTSFTAPVNVSLDGTGRIYAADGSSSGRVIRYDQRSPTGETVLAEELAGPTGIAVDATGNIFVAEQGASRIVLITSEGTRHSWVMDTRDPQYLSFTQY